MTAKKERARHDQRQDEAQHNGAQWNGAKRDEAQKDGPQQDGPQQDGESARAEANAKAAAQEAAHLAEETGESAAEGEEAFEREAEGAEPTALDQLQNEVDDLKDRLQRAVAETENVRRRAERERQEAVKYAASPLAKDLLGVADNLRRAVESVPAEQAEENEAVKSLLAGVQMTGKELEETLSKHGIRHMDIKPGDRFDPHYHEAMFEVPTDQQAPGTIVQVVQSGYMLHERLLRPARVGVAKAADNGGAASGNGQNVDTKA